MCLRIYINLVLYKPSSIFFTIVSFSEVQVKLGTVIKLCSQHTMFLLMPQIQLICIFTKFDVCLLLLWRNCVYVGAGKGGIMI